MQIDVSNVSAFTSMPGLIKPNTCKKMKQIDVYIYKTKCRQNRWRHAAQEISTVKAIRVMPQGSGAAKTPERVRCCTAV
jgi:hypothetical protein